MPKLKFYSLDNILSLDATYNLIIGERSNGKTFACLKYGLENYVKGKGKMAILRRWSDDFKQKRGSAMFDALEAEGVIKDLTDGKYTSVYYFGSRFFLCRYEGEKRIMEPEPFAYAFSISTMEHDKSTSYPDITTIIFDEFLSRGMYLPDEFVSFMNVISTIIRHRTDVKIFMLGNTVNQYCPYFKEMGIKNINQMEKGTIDVYRYGDSRLTVAVEYCNGISKSGKPSDFYFAFDNPKLEMITDGAWEIALYPHCPEKYAPKDILFTYFIQFEDDILQCEVVMKNNKMFTFIHEKTTPIKDEDVDIVFSQRYDPRPNWFRRLDNTRNKTSAKLYKFFLDEKVYYQDNQTGEIVRNYLLWCRTQALEK